MQYNMLKICEKYATNMSNMQLHYQICRICKLRNMHNMLHMQNMQNKNRGLMYSTIKVRERHPRPHHEGATKIICQ